MGMVFAIAILSGWTAHLLYSLANVEVSAGSPLMYLHILVQTYLFTGLFITGHDAMHGTVSKRRRLNDLVGYVSVFLYAGMSYRRLIRNHGLHHKYPGTDKDPDFNVRSQNFWVWWFSFMAHYVTFVQLVIMAVIFNILQIGFNGSAIAVFWVIPAFLSTLQLFYFGTYLPHRKPHTAEMGEHKARTQKKNHLWAMVSCYFFGYHYEHHESPRIPWWNLYRQKA